MTVRLTGSRPRRHAADARPVKLACRNVWKLFGPGAGELHPRARRQGRRTAELAAAGLVGAVRAVDLEIRQGEIFIIMGLSGSGKSTLVRCMSRLIEPTHGKVEFEGKDLLKISRCRADRAAPPPAWAWCSSISRCCRISPCSENIAFPLEHPGHRPGRRARRGRAR